MASIACKMAVVEAHIVAQEYIVLKDRRVRYGDSTFNSKMGKEKEIMIWMVQLSEADVRVFSEKDKVYKS
jgi:hypothetical protein